jgi:flavin-dependent dehydrogenase
MRPLILETDVAVIGAGIAGCAAALALRRRGLRVAVIEKAAGRPQRFCGEFVSGEVLEGLEDLGARDAVESLGPTMVNRLRLFGRSGEPYELDLGGRAVGVSRRALDGALLRRAEENGAQFLGGTAVNGIAGSPEAGFVLEVRRREATETELIGARAVVGAHGKRSPVDRLLGRRFLARPSAFVGVKQHYEAAHPGPQVELFLFAGGYGGIVGIEQGRANLCLLATRALLKQTRGRPEGVIEAAARSNLQLGERLQNARPVEGSLLAIGQIPFGPKEQVSGGVFLAGDSAGVQAPFLGLGIAAAVSSAAACAEQTSRWLLGEAGFATAAENYQHWWRTQLGGARLWGNLASRLMCNPALGEAAIALLQIFPSLGRQLYTRSRAGHGAPEIVAVR